MEELCQEFCAVDTTDQAPVNICLQDTKPIAVSDLTYANYDAPPTKMKLNNTGYTATVSGKYADGTCPLICGGPLTASYKFAQLHFHWGPDSCDGSEHTMECRRMPFELHVVHINTKYPNQEAALKEKDGVVILAYLFVPGKTNAALQEIVNDLPQISKPHSSFRITPRPISSLVPQFNKDYFTYWGAVISPSCSHLIQWLVCREPIELSPNQLEPFRKLCNVNNQPLERNYRDIQPLGNRRIFHCSPGSRTGAAITLSASRIALLQLVESCECPATDVEGACTSLEEVDSKSRISNPRSEQASAKPSAASIRGPSLVRSKSPSQASRSRPGTPTQDLQMCVPDDQAQQTAGDAECLESGRVSTDIRARATPSSQQVGAQPDLLSGKKLRGASFEAGTREEESAPADTTELPIGHEQAIQESDKQRQATTTQESDKQRQATTTQESDKQRQATTIQESDKQRQVTTTPPNTSQGPRKCCRPFSSSHALNDGPRLSSRGYMTRGISFSNIPGIKQRSGSEFPDNPFTTEPLRSPVDIDIRSAKRMPLPPLQFAHHFDPGTGLALCNSGETVDVHYLECIERPYITGGPLQGKYVLDSVHFHWIPCDEVDGGTHTINNTRTEIELHMVHVKETYSSKTEAMAHPNALAVVSILLQVGGEECLAFAKICQDLHKIRDLYSEVKLPDVDLAWLAPAAKPHDYFLYPGRFFGRQEGQPVLWIVYAQPVGICCQNVVQFQKLKMAADYKPHETYPLENRPLIAAVPMDSATGNAAAGSAAGISPGRTASGRIATIPRDKWPNVPYRSEHTCLCAPLDISTDSVQTLALPPLEFVGHFIPGINMELKNTGEAVNIKWQGVSPMPHLTGGPLLEDYEFDSAHFHWAQNPDDVGAMHRINSRRFDLECHMVHFRKSCKTRQKAMYASDGLCVVSFLLQVGGEDNPSFAQIAEALPKIRQVDTATVIKGSLCCLQNRAGPHGYFLYPGTLFGADKGINVIWIVYPTPVLVCCQYVAQFYKLECSDLDRMHPMHETLGRPIYHARDPESCGG